MAFFGLVLGGGSFALTRGAAPLSRGRTRVERSGREVPRDPASDRGRGLSRALARRIQLDQRSAAVREGLDWEPAAIRTLAVPSRTVFDSAFFGDDFAQMVRTCSREHDDSNVRVEIVTDTGERLDVLHLEAIESGIHLSTRDDRLVFLPYAHIAHVDVLPLTDQRLAGFHLSTSDA